MHEQLRLQCDVHQERLREWLLQLHAPTGRQRLLHGRQSEHRLPPRLRLLRDRGRRRRRRLQPRGGSYPVQRGDDLSSDRNRARCWNGRRPDHLRLRRHRGNLSWPQFCSGLGGVACAFPQNVDDAGADSPDSGLRLHRRPRCDRQRRSAPPEQRQPLWPTQWGKLGRPDPDLHDPGHEWHPLRDQLGGTDTVHSALCFGDGKYCGAHRRCGRFQRLRLRSRRQLWHQRGHGARRPVLRHRRNRLERRAGTGTQRYGCDVGYEATRPRRARPGQLVDGGRAVRALAVLLRGRRGRRAGAHCDPGGRQLDPGPLRQDHRRPREHLLQQLELSPAFESPQSSPQRAHPQDCLERSRFTSWS